MELINWWAVLVATVLAFILGGIWYGPVFGKAWLDALGKTEDDIEPSPTPFIISFFTAGLTAVVLAWLRRLFFTLAPTTLRSNPAG